MALINPKHLMKAGLYALAGWGRAIRTEQAFKHEALALPVIIIVLCFIRPGLVWAAVLVAAWLLVMAFELVNSAIEEAFDLITKDYNEHVKYGKDMASGAILMTLVINAILWLVMLTSVYFPEYL